ncbi:MAG TPA: flavodoxin domain-containing protein [Candidatus Dormibacteraeota bacterium]|nr:flavodoxin domain-containing protein [Candidatus Dormibacteraeota bacterium]
MNSVVIYGSHFGNTKKVAEAIATGLRPCGDVQVFSADEAPSLLPTGTDLLIVGGPTEGFRMTAPVSRFLERLDPRTVDGRAAAVFDTRVRPRWWLLGYAGSGIAKKLRGMGAHLVAPVQGFFVEGEIDEQAGRYPVLESGELERAAGWARSMASLVAANEPAHV